MKINKAIATLKKDLGDTNQAFAVRFGISMGSVSLYMRNRTPEPKALVLFLRCARTQGLHQIADLFHAELCHQLGIDSLGEIMEPLQYQAAKKNTYLKTIQ